jgi:hypothetical protein
MTRILSAAQTSLADAEVRLELVAAVDLMPRLKNIRGRKITSVIFSPA